MNPTESRELMADILRIRDRGITILLIEHDMTVVRGISDRVVALDHGVKMADGDFATVRPTRRSSKPTSDAAPAMQAQSGRHPLRAHHGAQGHRPSRRPGEIVCLLGGNASRKSTTMKTILGLCARPPARRVRGPHS